MTRIGTGRHRTVFSLGGACVLKVGSPSVNEREVRAFNQFAHTNMVPKVYRVSPHCDWVLCEKVQVFSERQFVEAFPKLAQATLADRRIIVELRDVSTDDTMYWYRLCSYMGNVIKTRDTVAGDWGIWENIRVYYLRGDCNGRRYRSNVSLRVRRCVSCADWRCGVLLCVWSMQSGVQRLRQILNVNALTKRKTSATLALRCVHLRKDLVMQNKDLNALVDRLNSDLNTRLSDNGVSFSWQVTASGEQEVLLTVPLWGSDTDVWGRTHSNEDAADAEQHVCNSIDMLVKGLTLKKGTP